jgi:hypothetical protein
MTEFSKAEWNQGVENMSHLIGLLWKPKPRILVSEYAEQNRTLPHHGGGGKRDRVLDGYIPGANHLRYRDRKPGGKMGYEAPGSADRFMRHPA